MFPRPNQKNRDIYICLLVIIISSLIAARSYFQIESNQEILTIKVPFNKSPRDFYGFYNQDNQCFGFLEIEKNFGIDIGVNIKGAIRTSVNNNTSSLNLSGGLVINSLSQIAYSNLSIKKSDKALFSFSTKNVNPIEITASFLNELSFPPLQYSLPGPILFTKASFQQYNLSIPLPSSGGNTQSLRNSIDQNYSILLSGIRVTEHSEIPAECSNENGAAMDLSAALSHYQELIQTQLQPTLIKK